MKRSIVNLTQDIDGVTLLSAAVTRDSGLQAIPEHNINNQI